MEYVFSDTDRAAERLRLLAGVFASSTRSFLTAAVSAPPDKAVDLGCGPGRTTWLITDTLRPRRTVGLDASAHFIELARQTPPPGAAFFRHDVTIAPFPEGPFDLAFARLLLTHLNEPAAVIQTWLGQLRSGGRLLIEEVESIATEHPIFSEYLTILERLMGWQSNTLYIGPVLDQFSPGPLARRRSSQVVRYPVANHDAARLFQLNIQVWRGQPFIQANYEVAVLDRLQADLTELARRPDERTEIEWGLRQIVFERA